MAASGINNNGQAYDITRLAESEAKFFK